MACGFENRNSVHYDGKVTCLDKAYRGFIPRPPGDGLVHLNERVKIFVSFFPVLRLDFSPSIYCLTENFLYGLISLVYGVQSTILGSNGYLTSATT